MRKRITSALMAGSRFFHLANMKGHVRYASLEAATDNSGVWEDRRLGVSETLVLPNETEFSFSANNATWEPDIERRCRRIRLRFHPGGHQRPPLPPPTSWTGCAATARNCYRPWPRWSPIGCAGHARPARRHSPRSRNGARWSAASSLRAGLPDPCLPHEDSQSSGDQATKAMRDFFILAFDHFGDAMIRKPDFQQFVQQNEEIHELFDWIDFASRQGQTKFGKLVVKFDKRELGGITFRIKQSSKNRADYRFFREGEGELPTRPIEPSSEPNTRGHGDIWGHSHTAYIREINDDEKNKKQSALNDLYIGDRQTSPNIPMSPRGVFCSLRSDLDSIALDLTGASRIALDIETYGERKGDGLDPWKGDIRLLTLCRHGGPSGPSTSAPSDTISARSSRSWRKPASSPTTPSSTCSGCG
jgi:hypothetical protein